MEPVVDEHGFTRLKGVAIKEGRCWVLMILEYNLATQTGAGGSFADLCLEACDFMQAWQGSQAKYNPPIKKAPKEYWDMWESSTFHAGLITVEHFIIEVRVGQRP